MNIRPLLDALDLQEDAARALADDLRAQIDGLQARLREAETHLEHLRSPARPSPASPTGSRPSRRTCPSTRTTPASSPPSNHAAGPLRAKDVCGALGHELLPKNIEGTRAKLKRLVKLGILTEADTANFARKQ
ncbi:hypothetical protein [Streptomyces canus]|uniref:hypothetical protein n=1 Tax=Streptomyces canus TaxID=58343 RepID=UPI0030DFD930